MVQSYTYMNRERSSEQQFIDEISTAEENRAVIDSFLIEHPHITEEAVRKALDKLSSMGLTRSNQEQNKNK